MHWLEELEVKKVVDGIKDFVETKWAGAGGVDNHGRGPKSGGKLGKKPVRDQTMAKAGQEWGVAREKDGSKRWSKFTKDEIAAAGPKPTLSATQRAAGQEWHLSREESRKTPGKKIVSWTRIDKSDLE